jgi:hypothetical protein
MNHLLDQSLVGLLLLISAAYALMTLGPKTLRVRIQASVSRLAARAPRMFALSEWAKRLEAAAGKPKGACGGCEDCGTGTGTVSGAGADAGSAGAQSRPAEIHIPVGKIGRRN